MVEPTEPEPQEPKRWMAWTILVVIVLAGGWMIGHLYSSPEARACGRMYRAAHNAADSARVDSTVPAERDGAGIQTHTCGFLRSNARWQ
ncbi:MAG: hypothetical protein ACREL4_10740 [Gemmatimonadales bacterium]